MNELVFGISAGLTPDVCRLYFFSLLQTTNIAVLLMWKDLKRKCRTVFWKGFVVVKNSPEQLMAVCPIKLFILRFCLRYLSSRNPLKYELHLKKKRTLTNKVLQNRCSRTNLHPFLHSLTLPNLQKMTKIFLTLTGLVLLWHCRLWREGYVLKNTIGILGELICIWQNWWRNVAR